MIRPLQILLAIATLLIASLAFAQTAKETPLLEGTQYVRVPGGAAFDPKPGKIELVEVFSYACSHCANFEPSMSAFAARLPKDVQVIYVPAAFNSSWEPYARAYEAARKLGVDRRSHAAVFKALHSDRLLPMSNAQPDELARFYAAYGVVPARFLAQYSSPAVSAALERNADWIQAQNVLGTPTLYVNGKFMPVGRSQQELLQNTAALIRQIRNGTIR